MSHFEVYLGTLLSLKTGGSCFADKMRALVKHVDALYKSEREAVICIGFLFQILWTALSVALGVELRGDLVRGAPCIKRYHQLFCPTAGNTYPM